MKISHKTVNISGNEQIYLYISVDDIYEFGKENLGKGEKNNLLESLRKYINDNFDNIKKGTAILVINGVVLGTITLSALYPEYIEQKNKENTKSTNTVVQIYKEKENTEEVKVYEEKAEQKEEKNIEKEVKVEVKKEENINTSNVTKPANNKSTVITTSNSTNKDNTQTTNKNTQTNIIKPTTNNTTNNETTKPNTNTTTSTTKPTTSVPTSGIKIKLNNGGNVVSIDLEEYVIGVVAAEMPASFESEALKAQAIAARTYAMKKHSKGITLINSTAHQVYNTKSQMQAKWGSSYNTYYNKIKNAVNATKSKVLKYNGEYIEAAYYAISNGKSEAPLYVWSFDYPYLQAVSSNWDKSIAAGKYTVTISYETLSKKLGVTVDKDSNITIISRTEGDRVNKIEIAGKTFTGVEVRRLLSLRSADFDITQNETGVKIETRGFGHGVGMSQYGANYAAKAGYTYTQILKHYYPGVNIVNI